MENITIKNLFNNIIILNYNDNNTIYKKILKVSFNEESIKRAKYEFENYELIMKTDYKCYFENFYKMEFFKKINNCSKLNFKINFNEKEIDISLNIKDILSKEDYKNNKSILYNISLLIGDYNEKKITFGEFIKNNSEKEDGIYKIIIILKKILKIINKLHINLYFFHLDLKFNNILILEEDEEYKIFLFDLEFAFYNNIYNEVITVYNDYPCINYYLDIPNYSKITNKFMRLFDYYLLSISIFSHFNIDIILQIKDELYKIIIEDKLFHLIIFYMITNNIIYLYNKNYYEKLNNKIIWYAFCNFNKTYDFFKYLLNNKDNEIYKVEYKFIKNIFEELEKIN